MYYVHCTVRTYIDTYTVFADYKSLCLEFTMLSIAWLLNETHMQSYIYIIHIFLSTKNIFSISFHLYKLFSLRYIHNYEKTTACGRTVLRWNAERGHYVCARANMRVYMSWRVTAIQPHTRKHIHIHIVNINTASDEHGITPLHFSIRNILCARSLVGFMKNRFLVLETYRICCDTLLAYMTKWYWRWDVGVVTVTL